MTKPLINLDGEKFQWADIDKPVCVYTIYAKSEKQAYKKLVKYLTSVGKLSSLDDMERWYEKGEV